MMRLGIKACDDVCVKHLDTLAVISWPWMGSVFFLQNHRASVGAEIV
jgi:hypothetical protein